MELWASVKRPGEAAELGFERCAACGLGLAPGLEDPALDEALEALLERAPDGGAAIRAPNRASLQAAVGGGQWAALEGGRQRLVLTRRSLELLLADRGLELVSSSTPRLGRNQRWMWQTALNGFTLRDNVLTDARAGRIDPRSGRERAAFAIDLIVSVLATPFVLPFTLIAELVAASLGRGGLLVARARPSHGAAPTTP